MPNPILIHFASSEELKIIKAVHQWLNEETTAAIKANLVRDNGVDVVLPDSLYKVIHQVIEILATNQGICVTPVNHELTTREAAEILNVSYSFLIKLLEQEAIPYHLVDDFKRISFQDLMIYKNQRDNARREMLTELTEMIQELGFYE